MSVFSGLQYAYPCITMYILEGGGSMLISFRLSEQENNLFKKYAEMNQMSVSDLIRQSVMERIEDEYDLKIYEDAMAVYQKNPVTYTHDEVKKILELD